MEALLSVVEDGVCKLQFQVQWRAGLRVSEARDLEVGHLALAGSHPALLVPNGKGGQPR